MKPSTINFGFRKNADSIIAGFAGLGIILLFTHHSGIGISPDAVVYSSVAENILSHGNLRDFNQWPVTDFPVFYPFLLSGIGFLTGTKPLFFAAFFNAFLFAIVIYLSGQIAARFATFSKWNKKAVLSCILLSPCLLEVYSMLWSETIFILLLLLFVSMLHRFFQTQNNTLLLGAASIAAIAAVTRYAGITFIATGALLLLIDRQTIIRKKISQLLLFAAISPLLLIINLARNYHVSGTLMGHREKAIRTWASNMHDAGTVFCNWLPFLNGRHGLAIAVLLFITIAIAAIGLWQHYRSRQSTSCEQIAASFFLVYIIFMIMSASISRYEELDNRLLSPLFIPFIWIGCGWLTGIIQKAKAVFLKRSLIAFSVIFFVVFQYHQITVNLETWDGVKDAGIPGYTEDEWRFSETVLFIQQNPTFFQNKYAIYSNAYDAVYFFTGKQALPLPHKEFTNEIDSFLHNSRYYVIWFNNGENPDLVDQSFIIRNRKMKLSKQFGDGAIYMLEE